MPGFNGSGTFVRTYNWTQDAANAIPIMASRFDTEDNGFATGLSNCITKDGQTTVTADISLSTHKLTNIGVASATTDAMSQAASDARYAVLATSAPTYKAYKTATTSRSSTTAFSQDPHLTVVLPAGTYSFELWFPFWCTTAATGGAKYQIDFSGSSTTTAAGAIGCVTSAISITPSNTFNTNFNVGTPTVGTASADWLRFNGTIIVTVSGTLSLMWAQLVSNGNALNVGIGAYLIATRIA